MYKVYYCLNKKIETALITVSQGFPCTPFFVKEYLPKEAEVIQVVPCSSTAAAAIAA